MDGSTEFEWPVESADEEACCAMTFIVILLEVLTAVLQERVRRRLQLPLGTCQGFSLND